MYGIVINNITTGSNNITLIIVNVKPYVFKKMSMDKDLKEDKLYQLYIDQFNERKVSHRDFHFVLLDNEHPFYNGNGRTFTILFANTFSSI